MTMGTAQMGRPTKLDKARTDKICSFIKRGSSLKNAFEASGISESCGFEWLKSGREAQKNLEAGQPHDQAFLEFLESIKRAEAEAEAIHVGNITKVALEGNWTASAWWLQRRRPESWNLDVMERLKEGKQGDVKLKMEFPKPVIDEDD